MAGGDTNIASQINGLPPMLREYQDYKGRYPECIIFFQVGDFFEVFFDDAVTVARALNLTLTSRDKNNPNPVPMCGVPVAAVEGYLERLVGQGFSVALVAQQNSYSHTRLPALLKDEGAASKLVIQRKLARIVTPGIRLLSPLDSSQSATMIAAVYAGADSEEGGLAYCEVQTGTIYAQQTLSWFELCSQIGRIAPREIILAGQFEGKKIDRRMLWVKRLERAAGQAELKFRSVSAAELTQTGYGRALAAIPGYAAAGRLAQKSVCLLIDYIDQTIVDARLQISEIRPACLEGLLSIDATTRKNLELIENSRDRTATGTLLWVVDHAVSIGGSKLLRQWLVQPLAEVEEIRRRQQAVGALLECAAGREVLRQRLRGIPDIERLAARIELGIVAPRELADLRDVWQRLPHVHAALRQVVSSADAEDQALLLKEMADVLEAPQGALDLLERALVDSPPLVLNEGGIIRAGFDAELDDVRSIKLKGRSWMNDLEAAERERTGIASLKVKFNYVLGFFIEVTRPNLSRVPDNYLRRQSTAGAERFTTVELKQKEAQVIGAEERQIEIERRLFDGLREQAAAWTPQIRKLGGALSQLDVFGSLAEAAERENYVRPLVDNSRELYIKKGKHPVLARLLEGRYVPNSLHLHPAGKLCSVLSGPNMGGKSTYLRQAGLIVILAQIGSYVPAVEARIGVVDKIFARMGASDNAAEGESTFMVEMREAAHIVQGATERSLLLVDEIGRGTATSDGLAIAQAVLEWIVCKVHCRTLFATHFHELTAMAQAFAEVGNLSVGSVEEGEDVVFTHEIKEGAASKAYGIEVAKLAGLPPALLARARVILAGYEKKGKAAEGAAHVIKEESAGAYPGQLSLFTPRPAGAEFEADSQRRQAGESGPPDRVFAEKIGARLRAVDLNSVTPLEALTLLHALKSQIEPGDSSLG